MSNGKVWPKEEKLLSSNEEATRAVSHDQFMSAIAQTDSRDKTRVAQSEVFPNQDPTKAINADQFYKTATQREINGAFEQDSNEEKTRALNTSDFNFQPPQPNQTVSSQQIQASSWPGNRSSYSSHDYSSYPQAYPEPYSNSPPEEYPSPQPRQATSNHLSTLHSPHISPKSTDQSNHFPPPFPETNKNAATQPQTQTIDEQKDPISVRRPTYELDSKASFSRDDLTQAHLKSEALAELITEHRYQEQPDHLSQSPTQSSAQRIKRSNLIIYGSVSLAILIIVVALSSTYLIAKNSLIDLIDQQAIPLIKLKAPYALALPKNINSQTENQNYTNDISSLHVFYTKQKLFYVDLQGEFEHEVTLQSKMLVPQVHPLRLNGSYLPKLIHHLESFWPKQNLQQLILNCSPSMSAGNALDLINTLVINNERKGQSYERYNLLIEQKNNSHDANQIDKRPKTVNTTKQNPKNNQLNLAMLPFKILFENDEINRNEYLQIKWSKTKKTVFIIGYKRRSRFKYKIPSRASSHQENRLANELKEKIDQIGALKGILITVPRSITLTELALWLAASAPYPVYLIPPKTSF